jgi:UDP-N-acetylglucosamine 2-epimerase (non-hydrolysing)
MKNILFIFGTRPEAIKMAPLIKVFQNDPSYTTSICLTGQHKEMLVQVMDFFAIEADINLMVMEPNQSLFTLTSKLLSQLEVVMDTYQPDLVFVQGDTTSVLAGAIAAFYKKVKIAHIEAGLRSHNMNSPFPEEMNRVLASRLTTYHFTPTEQSQQNLITEGIKENVYHVGNTVIDALFMGLELIEQNKTIYQRKFEAVDFNKLIILVTCHRRESFGNPFEEICRAIQSLVNEFEEVVFVYPVHLNPNIKNVANRLLTHERVILMDPLDYPHLLYILNQSHLVMTDSGGIQEEAPSLGKPVVVMREVTERMEGVEAGTSVLVGTDFEKITSTVRRLLLEPAFYEQMSQAINPYGQGDTAIQIKKIINQCRKQLEANYQS